VFNYSGRFFVYHSLLFINKILLIINKINAMIFLVSSKGGKSVTFLGKKSVASFLQVILTILLCSIIVGMLLQLVFSFWVKDSSNLNFPIQLENSGLGEFARITTPFPVSYGFNIFFWILVYTFQVMTAFIIFFAVRVFSFLKNNNPFSYEVVSSIKWIGVITIVMSSLQFLSEFGINTYFNHIDKLENGPIAYVRFNPGLSGMFFGLIILVIAHVFLEATKIKEEQNLTI